MNSVYLVFAMLIIVVTIHFAMIASSYWTKAILCFSLLPGLIAIACSTMFGSGVTLTSASLYSIPIPALALVSVIAFAKVGNKNHRNQP